MENLDKNLPGWLDHNFLIKILSIHRNDDSIEISSVEMKTGFSEHFGSSMFQCKIYFKSLKATDSLGESIDVVIKALPNDKDKGFTQNLLSDAPLFKTEIKMYNEVIPAINRLFKLNGMNVTLGPE